MRPAIWTLVPRLLEIRRSILTDTRLLRADKIALRNRMLAEIGLVNAAILAVEAGGPDRVSEFALRAIRRIEELEQAS